MIKKWLLITVFSLSALFILLLILGHFLHQNEQAQQAYHQQQRQAKHQNNQINLVISPLPKYKTIIRQHLICQQISQCELINTEQTQLGCWVAVNKIGAQLLKKNLVAGEARCRRVTKPEKVSCENNICMAHNLEN